MPRIRRGLSDVSSFEECLFVGSQGESPGGGVPLFPGLWDASVSSFEAAASVNPPAPAETMNKTIKILRVALDASPESWETRRHLAELLMEEGQYREARELLLGAPTVPSDEVEELFVAKHLVEHHPAKAAPFVDRVLKRNKGSAEAHWIKAQIFLGLGLAEDARKHYTTAAVLDDAYENSAFEASLEAVPSATEIPEARDVSIGGAEDTAPSAAEALSLESAEAEPLAASAPAAEEVEATPVARLATPPVISTPATAVTAPVGALKGRRKRKGRMGKPSKKGQASAPVLTGGGEAVAWTPEQLAKRIEATQVQAQKKNRAVAVFFAGVLHALVILLCLFWILKPGPLPEPSVIMSMKAPEDLREQIEKKTIAQYLPQRPSSSSASRASVIAANTTSPLAVPIVEVEEVTDDILGAGDSFGMGSGWGDGMGGGGGGSVRFFGDEQQAKRVCYIVDFSFSMGSQNIEGERRLDMLKRELIESIENLAPSMRYTVIFFSGMPWLQDENPESARVVGRQRMRDIDLDVTWYNASKKNKQATIDRINGMAVAGQRSGGGTIWMSGFEPAMKISPTPDLVYLLTDGMCQDYISLPNATHEEFFKEFIANEKAWKAFLGRMTDLVPTGVTVNTIAMEVAGTVAARLAELAQATGGDFSIVYEGKTYTGKRAIRFGDKDYDDSL